MQTYSSACMTFSEAPVDIEAVRLECDAAVVHAGLGTTTAMLLAGKPMLLLPMHTEQSMFAHRVEAMDAGIALVAAGIGSFARHLKKLLAADGAAAAARRFAARYPQYDQKQTVRRIADRCEALLVPHSPA